MRIQNGGLQLFRLFGIDVFLHWSWALLLAYDLQQRAHAYSNQIWNLAECLTPFAIVLMHEFGHALACRSVGGQANRIMLWPLGGVAFVNPPARPGAHLWSIAAGPLVNVILLPITLALFMLLPVQSANLHHFLWMFVLINGVLLVFNLVPIYPLDGGQILRSLLWFVIGPVRSLLVAAGIGLAGAAAAGALALWSQNMWLGVLALFGAFQSWNGFQYARRMSAMQKVPRHTEARCPQCGANPPALELWACPCGTRFDTFAQGGRCPGCGRQFDVAGCPDCRRASPRTAWYAAAPMALGPTELKPEGR